MGESESIWKCCKFYCVGYTAHVACWYLRPSGLSAMQIRILKWKNFSTTGYWLKCLWSFFLTQYIPVSFWQSSPLLLRPTTAALFLVTCNSTFTDGQIYFLPFQLSLTQCQDMFTGLMTATRGRKVSLQHGCTNTGVRPPWWLNSVEWRLIFVGPQFKSFFSSVLWCLEIWGTF